MDKLHVIQIVSHFFPASEKGKGGETSLDNGDNSKGNDESDGKFLNGLFDRFTRIRKSGQKDKKPHKVRPDRLIEVGGKYMVALKLKMLVWPLKHFQ